MKKKFVLAASAVMLVASAILLNADRPSPEHAAAKPKSNPPSKHVANAGAPAPSIPPAPIVETTPTANLSAASAPTEIIEMDEFSIPDPVEIRRAKLPEIELWQISDRASPLVVDGLPATEFKLDPKRLQNLQVGQTIRFDLPENNMPIEAEITGTYNDPGGIQVWKGQIKDEVRHSSVIITQGAEQTHIIIASTQGNFSLVMDNQSGMSTLVDEGTIHERQSPIDDGIVFQPDEPTDATHLD